MSRSEWCFAVQILRDDGTPVRQVPVTPDWDPLQEWLRFEALRRGAPVHEALALECTVAPRWSGDSGQPYLEGVRGHAHAGGVGEMSADCATAMFSDPAKVVATQLVTEGVLADGEVYRFVALAFAKDASGAAPTSGRFNMRPLPPALPIAEGSLSSFIARCGEPRGAGDDHGDDCPVFIPEATLDEARTLAHEAEARETGGLLIGHLRRDPDQQLFVEVTAQLPALHVDATQTRLTFTSDTWTQFRAALELRGRGEIMLGWWHSHPVREWCKACPEAKQRVCSLRGDFLSEDDRLLHRAIFPRAYSIALVVNDVGYEAPTVSLFGWRRGQLSLRGYHALNPVSLHTLDPIQETHHAGV